MFVFLTFFFFFCSLSHSQNLQSKQNLESFVYGTIKLWNGKIESKSNSLSKWKTAYKSFKDSLKNRNIPMTIFQNSQNVFPPKKQYETRIEYDGPRSDESIAQNQVGYRGVNRFVVYVRNYYPNDRSGCVIQRVFLSNDHYSHGHECISGCLKELGGTKLLYMVYKTYNNIYLGIHYKPIQIILGLLFISLIFSILLYYYCKNKKLQNVVLEDNYTEYGSI